MSVKVMANVWEHTEQKANKLLLLLALADNANDDGWAYPSQVTLAEKCRVGRRAVQKMLDELEAEGEVIIFNRTVKGSDQHFTNVYHLPRYGNATSQAPTELRGELRQRTPGSRVEMEGGSEQPDTTPSEQPDRRVANSGSHDPSVEPSVDPSVNDLATQKPRNAMFDAVSWAWQNQSAGYVGKLIKFLTGKCVPKDGKYHTHMIHDPLTPLEVVAFRLWRDYHELDMPKLPETIERLVEEFRGVPEYDKLLEAAQRHDLHPKPRQANKVTEGNAMPEFDTPDVPVLRDADSVLDGVLAQLGGG